MSDINIAALPQRTALINAIAAASRSSALSLPSAALNGGPALSRLPLTHEQAAQVLRHVVASQLPELVQHQSPQHQRGLIGAATIAAMADQTVNSTDLLRVLIGETTSALARALPAAGNPLAFESARAALWQALVQRFASKQQPVSDNSSSDQRTAVGRGAQDWAPFAWIATPASARNTKRRINKRQRGGTNSTGQDDHVEGHAAGESPTRAELQNDPALLDIMEWLQRQSTDNDYTAIVSGDENGRQAGRLFDENV